MIYTMDWFFNETFTDIIKVLLSIDSIIYWLIAQFFRFVIDIASADFIMTDLLNTIIDRAYVVAGVFALFIMSYALIKGLFDPDGAFKGKNSIGQIIKNLLIAIALVALMPTIFTYLFRFQAIIINNNVIGNIVLGNDSQAMKFKVNGEEQEVTVENVGYENYIKVASNNVAFTALNAFIYADDNDKEIDLSQKITAGTFLTPRIGSINATVEVIKSLYLDNSGNNTTTFNQVKNNIVVSGNFLEINTIAYHVATGGDFENDSGAHVTYLFIVSTICGIVLLVLSFTFCINIVIRMFNLFLLELISPIASFSLVIPNSKIFDNWLKATMKEYLDLFVRLFTFNLAILFFSNIQTILHQVNEARGNTSIISIMNILFVVGLLIFINEAPKLVKDILGMKDDKKGIKDRLFSGGVSKTLGGALGLLGGGAAAGMGIAHAFGSGSGDVSGGRKAWNAIKGAASGFGAGKNASKAKSFSDFTGAVGKSVSAMDANRKKGDLYYKQHGGTFKSAMLGRLEDAKNYVTGADPFTSYKAFQAQEGKMNDIKKDIDGINELADKNAGVARLKNQMEDFKNSKISKEDFIHQEQQRAQQMVDNARSAGERTLRKTYLDKILKDEKTQNAAYQNYMVGFQNKLQKLDTDYKVERSNYINSQAASAGTDINMAIEKIYRDLQKEKTTGNEYVKNLDIEDIFATNGINKSKVLDDIKDGIFGKSELVNDKETAIDITDADLAGVINDSDIKAVLGTKAKKVWDGTRYVTVTADTDAATLASLGLSMNETDQVRYNAVLKGIGTALGLSDDDRRSFGEAHETELKELMNNVADYYNYYTSGDSRMYTSDANITNIVTNLGLPATVNSESLLKAITNANSGFSRNATPGTIQAVHGDPKYQAAREQAEIAYEKEKENK